MSDFRPSAPRPGLLRRHRHLASGALPLLVWGGAVFALFCLAEVTPALQRVPAMADATCSTVVAPAEARITTIAVQLHQFVEQDQVLARLDDRDVRLRLTQAGYELERLRADMARVQADLERDAKATADAHGLDTAVEHRRLSSALETAQLGAVAVRAELEESRIRLQGAAVESERLAMLAKQGIANDTELVRANTERDALKKRLDELTALYDEHRGRIATAKQRLAEFTPTVAGALPIDTALAPLRWRLKEQETQVDRIALDAQALDLKSPIRGHIASIDSRAGEWAVAGRKLLTVVDATPRRLVAYVPDGQRDQLDHIKTLQVRRLDSSALGDATILSISPSVVLLPERLRRDPRREEWGYEIVLAATGAEHPGERLILSPAR
ncbi:MAG: HlyD family efflux transporter periplasmic adaptor subunit [Planctomycetes bacterium]|nr:HlyD family efflux transporter periplasmic adaptor subunit [Planctomycetota bacterium]